MTIYQNPVTGPVVGQPIAAGFGVQNSGTQTVAPSPIAIPPTMPLLEACARGVVPRNSMVTAVNGVSTGAQNPTPIDDLMGNGAGNQVNLGVAVAGVAGNPVSNGAINQQQFVDGTSAVAQSANGPTPTGTETLTSGPVSGATTGANITLGAGQFQG